jgi:23S rRNA pseudouridine1911/1915/1917 synthase
MLPDYRVGATPSPPVPEDSAAEDVTEPLEAMAAEASEVRRSSVAAAQHAERLDKFLVKLVPEFSRSYLQGLIEGGHVRVNDVVVTTASHKVHVHQTVAVELVPTPESRAFRAEPLPLDVVFEDRALMVISKPAGMVVHPAAGNWSGTVLNALLAHHAGAASLPRAGIVHRLDKDTSGLMVVGKTLESVTALVRSIAAREVHRQYLALAHGGLRQDRMRIEMPLARDPQSRIRMAVVPSGKPACTDVERIAFTPEFSAVRCTLHTGRTHQIRVHLAHAGHPLVADAVYGGRAALGLQRQALHAVQLAFTHPLSGEPLVFTSLPPADFQASWIQVAGSKESMRGVR